MLEYIWVKIGSANYQDLCELHDQWQKDNPGMADQDMNYMIQKLIMIAKRELPLPKEKTSSEDD